MKRRRKRRFGEDMSEVSSTGVWSGFLLANRLSVGGLRGPSRSRADDVLRFLAALRSK